MTRIYYGATENYETILDTIVNYHEQENPLSHIKKYEIIKGDACVELPKYLSNHPETIISLAYFDFDIYQPTKVYLEAIQDRLTKGSVVAFDELNEPTMPGETVAVMEALGGVCNIRLKRPSYASRVSYFVVE